MDFSKLQQWQRFEHLCRLILSIGYADFHSVEGSGGDEGIDGYTGLILSPTVIFQFKYFPGKLKTRQRKKIESSLDVASNLYPEIWHLILPAELNPTDWKWWDSLKSRYPEIEYRIWDHLALEEKVLKFKEQLMTEFPELFPAFELADKLGDKLYQIFHDELTNLGLAESKIQLLTHNTIPHGSKDCWKNGHFRIGDIKDDYDARRNITDKVLDLIEKNIGVLIAGRSHVGKTTLIWRIAIEEIKKGYLILSISNSISNSFLITKLLQRMLNASNKKMLVIVDNADNKGIEEVLRCYNDLKYQRQIHFVFVARNIGLASVVKVLPHDDQKEVNSALASMEKIKVEFTEEDGNQFVKKANSLYDLHLDELQVTALTKHFYKVSRGDPLIYVCMIIGLIKNKIDPDEIEIDSSDPFMYLEYDFNEKIDSLNNEQYLWRPAICCIFLGGWGFRLSSDLLKKLGVYTDDIIKLSSIGILFSDSGEYTLRHERWGVEFLLYLYTSKFGEDIDSFDHKYNLADFIKTLLANLAVSEIITLINRLESMLAEKKFVKLVKSLMGMMEIPSHLTANDAADVLCYGFGNFYQAAKEYPLAINYYEKAIGFNPDHWSAWNNMGNIYESLEKYAEAKDSYTKSIAIHAENADAYYNKAKILNREGKHYEALECIENAIYYDPQYTWAYLEEGNILVEMDKPQEAMIFYNRAIEFDPSNSGAWLNIGNAMLKLKNYDYVSFFLDMAERIDPVGDVIYAKGVLAKETSRYDDAAKHFSKALELQPNNLNYLGQAGIVQLLLDNVDFALRYFEQVLQINGYDRIALGNSALCLIRLKRIKEAILNIARIYRLISTEEDKMGFRNLIRTLAASMLAFYVHISDLSVAAYLDSDLLLLYLATFIDTNTAKNIAEILGFNIG